MELEGVEQPANKRRKLPALSTGTAVRPAPNLGPTVAVPCRVVLHLDLDCFYCQVEQLRLSIPQGTPCAVQQWEGLIAVNYEARAAGVTRHMRAAEARKVCPGIRLVHVQTIGENGEAADEQPEGPCDDGRSSGRARLKEKACLERYRQASAQILALIRKTVPSGVVVEKASIDEVYVDVTPMVDVELRSRGVGASDQTAEHDRSLFAWGSIVKGCSGLQGSNWLDVRFAIGASICARLRGLVRSELGYTVSGGVASNKLLAKLGSAMHKPNQQTLILPRAVANLMAELPLEKINGFGGKLGAEVQELGCTSAGEVAALPLEALQQRLGVQRGTWVFNAVRGICEEPVTTKGPPKSMLAAKSFNSTNDTDALKRWIGILSEELASRMTADEQAHQRRAKNIVLHWRGGRGGRERSKSGQLPPDAFAGGRASASAIARFGMGLLQRAEDALPCSRLALSTTEFAEVPVGKAGSITRFFQPRSSSATVCADEPSQLQPRVHKPAEALARETTNKKRGIHVFLTGGSAAGPAGLASCSPSPTAAEPRSPRYLVGSPSSLSPGSFPMWSAGFRMRTPQHQRLQVDQDTDLPLVVRGVRAPGDPHMATGGTQTPECKGAAPSERGNSVTNILSRSQSWEGSEGCSQDMIAGVDVEEQKKILRDIEMRRAAACPRSPVGRRPQPHLAPSRPHGSKRRQSSSVGGKRGTVKKKKVAVGHSKGPQQQRSIASMFRRPS